MKELHELREMLCEELKSYGKKGDLSAGSLATIDTLAHALKNIDKVIEADSGSYAYDDRGSYRGGYSRSRYRDGYSRSDLTDKLRDLMNDSSDERTRMEIKRLIDKME